MIKSRMYVEKYYHNDVKYIIKKYVYIDLKIDYDVITYGSHSIVESTKESRRYLTFDPKIKLEPLGKLKIFCFDFYEKKKIIITFWSTIFEDGVLKIKPNFQRDSKRNLHTITIEPI